MTYGNLFIPNFLIQLIDRETHGRLTKPAVEKITKAATSAEITDLVVSKLAEQFPDYPKVGTEKDFDGTEGAVISDNVIIRNIDLQKDKAVFDIKFESPAYALHETTKFFSQLGFSQYSGGCNVGSELKPDQFAQYDKEQPLEQTLKEQGFVQIAVDKSTLFEKLGISQQVSLIENRVKAEVTQGTRGKF